MNFRCLASTTLLAAFVSACAPGANRPAPVVQNTALAPAAESDDPALDPDDEPAGCPEGMPPDGPEGDCLENPDAPNVCMAREADGTCTRLERHGSQCATDSPEGGCVVEPVHERCAELNEIGCCSTWEAID